MIGLSSLIPGKWICIFIESKLSILRTNTINLMSLLTKLSISNQNSLDKKALTHFHYQWKDFQWTFSWKLNHNKTKKLKARISFQAWCFFFADNIENDGSITSQLKLMIEIRIWNQIALWKRENIWEKFLNTSQ